MYKPVFSKILVLVALGALAMDSAQAFNFGNMMNPSKWWGSDRDRHDDDYYGAPPYGYGYPAQGYAAPGYAAPAYTAPTYTAPAYTAPGYAAPGYAVPGYGYSAPAYTAPAAPAPAPAPVSKAAPAKPAPSAADEEAEIARLKDRIRELEAIGNAAPPEGQHPYDKEYRFPDSAAATGGQGQGAVQAAPDYPVYSPYGPQAEFPPLSPDDETAAPPQIDPVPGVVETQAPAVANPAAPADGPVNYTPYGNPANYKPPMQDISGTRVYEFGR